MTHLALVMDNWTILLAFRFEKINRVTPHHSFYLIEQTGWIGGWWYFYGSAERIVWSVVSPSLQLQLLKTMSNQFALQECQVRFESNKLTKRTLYLRGPLDLQAWSDLRRVWIVGLQGHCYLLLSTTASFEILSNIHSHFRQCDGCKGASGMISNPDWWSSPRLL